MPLQKKQDKRPAFSDAALHGAGDGHCGGAGCDGIGAIRLLGIGGRRDGDLPGNGGKGTGGSIVGVVVSFLPRIAVIRHRQTGEGRVEVSVRITLSPAVAAVLPKFWRTKV